MGDEIPLPQDETVSRGEKHPNRMEAIRNARGYSRKQMALLLGCHESQVFKVERGDTPMTLDWLYRVATALHCLPFELLPLWEQPSIKKVTIERLWSDLSEADRAETLANLRKTSPELRAAPPPAKEKLPQFEVAVSPDGSYRATFFATGSAFFAAGVPPIKIDGEGTPEIKTVKDQKIPQKETG